MTRASIAISIRHFARMVALLFMAQIAAAGSLSAAVMESRGGVIDEESAAHLLLPEGASIIRDVSYGSDDLQRFDVYTPKGVKNAPVILMVHGGAWFMGDKSARAVVENKVAHWLPKGFIVVSTNYRMLPKADPLEQARDVARALATAQERAASWGGDPSKFILMGHSAGAHLAALLAASPSTAYKAGARPWCGTILLDSAALDLARIMKVRHFRFYDRAFGSDPAYWRSASPYYALTGKGQPILAVCSTRRIASCDQARRFASKANSLGAKVTVLPEDLSHKDINQRLGEKGDYTGVVDFFIAGLDESAAKLLGQSIRKGKK